MNRQDKQYSDLEWLYIMTPNATVYTFLDWEGFLNNILVSPFKVAIIWSILVEVNQYKLAREKTVKLTSKKGKKSELNEVHFRSIKWLLYMWWENKSKSIYLQHLERHLLSVPMYFTPLFTIPISMVHNFIC